MSIAVDDRQVALQALRTLAPRQRAAIVLTEVLRYTAEEAGRMLGIRASTVRALHFQARLIEMTQSQITGAGGASVFPSNPVKAIDEWNYCRYSLRLSRQPQTDDP